MVHSSDDIRPVKSRKTIPFLHLRYVAAMLIVISWLGPPMVTPSNVAARSLGEGSFSVSASVFGTASDGRIGEVTTNGRTILPFDRMVALPACTESSCPWLSIFADPDDTWGPQTACAEENGLCWVQVISQLTGACTVAPVLELGPLFKTDNWWEARENRRYDLKRGLTAAEVTLTGVDLGFGEGISETGLNIPRDFPNAPALSLGAGTWLDLGLDPNQSVTGVKVKLLWQDGTNHVNACDGVYGNAKTIDQVNLRAGPSLNDAILDVLKVNHRLSIAGASKNGFYQVDINGNRGWVFGEWARPDGGKTQSAIGFVTDVVNFRAGPSIGDDILQSVPAGSVVVLTGAEVKGFLPVTFLGKAGWISTDWVDTGDDDSGSGGSTDGDQAITTDSVNFRDNSSLTAKVIEVLPVGTVVTLRGKARDGFTPVTVDGNDGWVWSDFLAVDPPDNSLTVDVRLNLRDGPSTSDAILLVMPEGAEVTVTGKASNGFIPVTYKGTAGWAFAQYLS